MRKKDEDNDYRYFPEPDLVPIVITDEKIEEVRRALPELQDAKIERLSLIHILVNLLAQLLCLKILNIIR